MKEPSVSTAERRKLTGDPEFPFWTHEPKPGHVFFYNGVIGVFKKISPGTPGLFFDFLVYNSLLPDGSDSGIEQRMPVKNFSKIKIIDRMYSRGPGKPFEIDMIDYSQIAIESQKMTHVDKIPDNPLACLPFWGEPEGKNLTILACLKWAETHLTYENNRLPCLENKLTLKFLIKAIKLQEMRQEIRRKQGLLGTNHPHISDSTGIVTIVDSQD
jgi:hypothetical protein